MNGEVILPTKTNNSARFLLKKVAFKYSDESSLESLPLHLNAHFNELRRKTEDCPSRIGKITPALPYNTQFQHVSEYTYLNCLSFLFSSLQLPHEP